MRVLNREDMSVPAAVRTELPTIARAVDRIVDAFRRGGRLFYVGAGTSGRLGALDAAECPPTFGISSRMVQSVIAGGSRALVHSVEGAEDSTSNGARDLKARKLTSRDIVVGIAASGTTPYVLGALRYARTVGAFTIGLTADPKSPVSRAARIAISPRTGPEAIVGSTRMKAGTAHKLVLNMLSTASMVRLGYVYDNWMVNVAQSNEKLRRRALRILQQAAGLDASSAEHVLRQAEHDLRVAIIAAKTGLNVQQAKRTLERANGNVRSAIFEASRSRFGNRVGLGK